MKTRKLLFDTLEDRRVLAATADIVFLVDESESTTDKGLPEWASFVAEELDDKLSARGIGSVEPNRFALIGFGGANNVPRSILLGGQNWTTDVAAFQAGTTQLQNAGGREDGWAALAFGLENYSYRPHAAVQFVLVADQSGREETGGSYDDVEMYDLLEELRAENLNTTTNETALSDAIVTAVASGVTEFEPNGSLIEIFRDFFAAEGDPNLDLVFGLDIDVLDGIDLDRNSPRNNLAGDSTNSNDESVFFGLDADDQLGVEDWPVRFADQYEEIRQEYIVGHPDIAAGYPSADYAFLAWESRGTTWDILDLTDGFSNGQFPQAPDSLFQQANEAFVDDVFEKIKLQVADFDESGHISSNDIDTFIASIGTANNLNRFDLDGNGVVQAAGVAGGDMDILIKSVLATWYGDANLDYEFGSSDFVSVFQSGKFETGAAATWSEGDWNGDGLFTTSDFVVAFQDGGFENGLRFIDVGGTLETYIPIWDDPLDSFIYFPEWMND